MVMKEAELGPLCSCNPPNHAQSSIEATCHTHQYSPSELRILRTNQVLQLTGPQPIVLIEGVLVSHSLETGDFLLLSKDLSSHIVKHGLHYN